MDYVWHNLSRTASVADEGHSFSAIIVTLVPPRCMKYRSLEFLNTRELGFSRFSDTSDGRNEYCGFFRVALLCPFIQEGDLPYFFALNPTSTLAGSIKDDVGTETEFVHCSLHILGVLELNERA